MFHSVDAQTGFVRLIVHFYGTSKFHSVDPQTGFVGLLSTFMALASVASTGRIIYKS